MQSNSELTSVRNIGTLLYAGLNLGLFQEPIYFKNSYRSFKVNNDEQQPECIFCDCPLTFTSYILILECSDTLQLRPSQ